MRAAGILPMITVGDPFNTKSGGPLQISLSSTRDAGILPIFTVGQPVMSGPPTCGTRTVTIGHTCMSVMRAAGGIVLILPVTERQSQTPDHVWELEQLPAGRLRPRRSESGHSD